MPKVSEQKLINLAISLLWMIVCSVTLIISSLLDEIDPPNFVATMLTLILAMPALGGLYTWRWYTLQEALRSENDHQQVSGLWQSPHSILPLSIFSGLSPISQLTWFAQSFASLCLGLALIDALRPLMLIILIPILLWIFEIQLLARFLLSLTHRSTQTLAAVVPQPKPAEAELSSPRSLEIPTQFDKPHQDKSHQAGESDESHDEQYETLLALREQIEQTENSQLQDDPSDPIPRQTIRDFRDAAGFGTISGESRIEVTEQKSSLVVTLAFMPPFPLLPEVLADCEDECVTSVHILQVQPLGAKIEIQLGIMEQTRRPTEIQLFWEATLGKK